MSDAIERLRREMNVAPKHPTVDRDLVALALKEFDNLALKLPSWRKVADSLPADGTHTLATFRNGDIEMMWFENGDWWGSDRPDEPIHWMPLPEPPK
jgi:hypothetical protein